MIYTCSSIGSEDELSSDDERIAKMKKKGKKKRKKNKKKAGSSEKKTKKKTKNPQSAPSQSSTQALAAPVQPVTSAPPSLPSFQKANTNNATSENKDSARKKPKKKSRKEERKKTAEDKSDNVVIGSVGSQVALNAKVKERKKRKAKDVANDSETDKMEIVPDANEENFDNSNGTTVDDLQFVYAKRRRVEPLKDGNNRMFYGTDDEYEKYLNRNRLDRPSEMLKEKYSMMAAVDSYANDMLAKENQKRVSLKEGFTTLVPSVYRAEIAMVCKQQGTNIIE